MLFQNVGGSVLCRRHIALSLDPSSHNYSLVFSKFLRHLVNIMSASSSPYFLHFCHFCHLPMSFLCLLITIFTTNEAEGYRAGPTRRPAWLAGGEWPSRVWFGMWWTVHAACPDGPHHLPRSGAELLIGVHKTPLWATSRKEGMGIGHGLVRCYYKTVDFASGCITERCLHNSRKVSQNDLVSQFLYNKRLNYFVLKLYFLS